MDYFITIASIVLEICSRQKSSMKITKGNNSKLRQARAMFMCTALPLNEIYPPTKFHNHSKYSLRDVHWTKFKYEKKKKKTKGQQLKN